MANKNSKKSKRAMKAKASRFRYSLSRALKQARALDKREKSPDVLAHLKTPLSEISIDEIVIDVVRLSLKVTWEEAELLIFRAAETFWCREIQKDTSAYGNIKLKGVKPSIRVSCSGGRVRVESDMKTTSLDVKTFQLKALEEILE
jgi:hypothetical protein